jgi:hypothetical protein
VRYHQRTETIYILCRQLLYPLFSYSSSLKCLKFQHIVKRCRETKAPLSETPLYMISWSFIYDTLIFLNFGESVIEWVNTFYKDITSAVTQNCSLSEFFNVQRVPDDMLFQNQ